MTTDEGPFLATWATSQAWDLAFGRERPRSPPERNAANLDTAEGKRLLQQLAMGGASLVVLADYDPATRADLTELVRHGVDCRLTIALSLPATRLVTPELVRALAEVGLSRLRIGIDGPDAASHDAFRGIAGSFEESRRILKLARDASIATQVDTVVHAGSIERLGEIAELVQSVASVAWSVSYFGPLASEWRKLLSAERVEHTLIQLASIAERGFFEVETVAAPHFQRVLTERQRTGARTTARSASDGFAVNDGRGQLFVSHVGEIFPSRHLTIGCGNVREVDPTLTYRYHPTFRALRDASALVGKCGACEYRGACGGSRARGYALTGSLFASDPLCAYAPQAFSGG